LYYNKYFQDFAKTKVDQHFFKEKSDQNFFRKKVLPTFCSKNADHYFVEEMLRLGGGTPASHMHTAMAAVAPVRHLMVRHPSIGPWTNKQT
jgi:hypothetical protein